MNAILLRSACLSVLFLASVSVAATTHAPAIQDRFDHLCASPEECFRAAVTLPDVNSSVSSLERTSLKVERLQKLRERHPGSLWARRAGVLSGLLLMDRNPGEAARFFRTARRDFPLLDDYLRFWLGETYLKIGDTATAATVFESIPEAVPDTLLESRAAYRTGDAWVRGGQCTRAVEPLARAVSGGPSDLSAPTALLQLADCQAQLNHGTDAQATLKHLWVRYPNSPEAREAAGRLAKTANGHVWHPTADDLFERGSTFLTLALHEEAVEELKKFLAASPHHARREEAQLKLGTAYVRLRRYEEARDLFQVLASSRTPVAAEAVMWLGRIYLRLDDGPRLLALQASPRLPAEQRGAVLLFSGTWLEDHDRPEEALDRYRQAARTGNGSRSEALWRIGWLHYRAGRYAAALESLQELTAGKDDPQWTPQALYWLGRTHDRLNDGQGAAIYSDLCRRYAFTYYCQLAQREGQPAPVTVSLPATVTLTPGEVEEARQQLSRDVRYLKAVELKIVGMDQDAARELGPLLERVGRERGQIAELSALLSDAGAYHQALRLVRLHFRDPLERGGDPLPPALWSAGYPMVYLPAIKTYGGPLLDPLLAAALIREESQYDPRALSRVGAVGLMQLMPATAQAVARRFGSASIGREELFDQDTNIRFGVRYLEQLLEQFAGNIIYAVASYNAGPSAVSGWIAKFGGKDPDEFVELIPYQETRWYVKRVLRSYREYGRLTGSTCAARSLDKVC